MIAGGAGRTLIFADELGPLDANFRVVPGHTAFIIGMPEIIDFIAEFRHVTENQEPMSKTFGNEELLLIFFRQFDAVLFAIGLGITAQIASHIKNTAADSADELALGKMLLEMKPCKTPFVDID